MSVFSTTWRRVRKRLSLPIAWGTQFVEARAEFLESEFGRVPHVKNRNLTVLGTILSSSVDPTRRGQTSRIFPKKSLLHS